MRWRGLIISVVVLGTLGIVGYIFVRENRRPVTLQGAIVQFNDDTNKESPIADVEVGAAGGLAAAGSKSDFSGFFGLTLRPGIKRGDPITLEFRHPDYFPLDLHETVGDKLYVARMKPLHVDANGPSDHAEVVVANVLIRYSIETTSEENIGSGVKIFQITNTGNIPCDHAPLCSPDGKWKASVGGASLDAGTGNEFRNARVSCIAGPCPFTRIDSDHFSSGGRSISATVRGWSDTTTFVLQAEVFRIQVNDIVREYYPTVIGRTLNFTLPAAAAGLSVEAELNGVGIEFPLGPNPILSWADCKVSTSRDHARAYRCELKPWCRLR